MTASRTQHVIAASVVLIVGLIVAWISFTQQPAEAFLFPRLIAVAFVALAGWNFYRAASGLARIGEGMSLTPTLNMLPGLLVLIVLIFYAAKAYGFYLSSTVAFFAIYTLYDPVPLSDLRGWLRRILVTAAFMAVIYALFALLLQVQTPRGAFF